MTPESEVAKLGDYVIRYLLSSGISVMAVNPVLQQKTWAVYPDQTVNISTVLCMAVSGMPPIQWRGLGIHQHTGKREWGLNSRALSHCHSGRYVVRHCLESALLVSRTKKKSWIRFMAPLRRFYWTLICIRGREGKKNPPAWNFPVWTQLPKL